MYVEIPIGAALTLVGLAVGARRWLRRSQAVQTSGKVIRIDRVQPKRENGKTSKTFRAMVQFVDEQGAIRFFSAAPEFEERKVGDVVRVLYPRKDPGMAWIDDIGIFAFPLVVVVLGVVLLGYGIMS